MSSQTTTANGTASFDSKLPLLWTREEVKDWVLRYVRLYGQQQVKVTNFEMTGVLLCNLTLEEFCQNAGKQVGEKMFEDLAERKQVKSNARKHRPRRDSDEGINQIIKIHTDRHRSVLTEIDDAIQTVLETGELPLFENEMTLERVFVSMLNLLPLTKQSEHDYCTIREVVKQPLFVQKELPAMLAVQAPNIPEEYILSHGLLRLLVEVDAVIHSFLQSHLCKNARQVEALIRNTIAIRSWTPTAKTPVTSPPVLVLPSMEKPTGTPVTDHTASIEEVAAPDLKPSHSAISCTSTLPSIGEDKDTDESDGSLDNERNYNNNNRLSHISPFGNDSGHASDSHSSFSEKLSKQSSTHSIPYGYGAPHTPHSPGPSTSSQGSEISTEDFEEMNPLIYGMGIDAPRVWSTRLTQLDDYFASSYGNHYYVDLKYDPSFHIEFLIGPNVKALNNSMAVLRGKHPYVTFSITNNTTTFVGFAVRCFNFNSPHNPRVIYPIMGLEVLEPSSVPWVRHADLPHITDKQDNYLVVEMLVCRTEVTAVWNVQRRYIIQLTDKSEMSSSTLNHIGSDVASLGLNLKQVMMSGLFYMAQDRLSDAEVLFSHALHLPDFQRPEMKAYSLICLAMVLNKKRKNRRANLVQVIGFTTAAKQLISAARNVTKIRMPTLIELVERLYEDLNLPQLIRHAKRKNMSTPIIDVTEEEVARQSITEETGKEDDQPVTSEIGKDGGSLVYDESLSITIPPMTFTKSTNITLKPTDKDEQLHQRASEMMLSPLLAIEVSTSPKTSFNNHITINAVLKSCPSTMGSQVRVLHGDTHLQNLTDITEECEVNLDPKMPKLTISTKNEGNIFAAAVCSDPVILYKRLLKITQTRSPFCLQVSAYSSVFPNDHAVEVTVIGVPHVVGRRDSHAALPNTNGLKLISRRKLTVEVYSDDTLKYELKGNFVPHDRFGESTLTAEFEPSMTTSFLDSKWVKLITLESSHNPSPHNFVVSGKLIISRKRDSVWQEIQSLNLFG